MKPKMASCPTHGFVAGEFTVSTTHDPSYTTGAICPKCYVDWVHAHVQAVTPLALTAARTPTDGAG